MFDEGPAAALERLVFGPTASVYRRFVRLTLALTVVLAVANGIVVLDIVAVGPTVADALYLAGAVVFTVFILSGLVQLVALARAYERGTRAVAETADDLETAASRVAETADEVESAAAEVAESADEVETAASTVEATAGEVETAVDDVEEAAEEVEQPPEPPDPERAATAKAQAEDAKSKTAEAKDRTAAVTDRTEAAKDLATDVEQTAERTKETLPADTEEGDEDRD